MQIYSAFILFSLIIIVYMIIAEVFIILFRFTGMNREKASFQVVSLLTGSGFTTDESELVTSSLPRRRLAKVTMMFGYVFNITFVSAFVNVFLSFKQAEIINFFYDVAIPVGVLILILAVLRIPQITAFEDRMLEKLISRIIRDKGYNNLTVIDNVGGKTLAGITLKHLPERLKDKTMADNGLKKEHGIIVLLVEDEKGMPNDVHASTVLKENEKITVLGDYNTICRIFHARERFVE